jgi:hypothetical protein
MDPDFVLDTTCQNKPPLCQVCMREGIVSVALPPSESPFSGFVLPFPFDTLALPLCAAQQMGDRTRSLDPTKLGCLYYTLPC